MAVIYKKLGEIADISAGGTPKDLIQLIGKMGIYLG